MCLILFFYVWTFSFPSTIYRIYFFSSIYVFRICLKLHVLTFGPLINLLCRISLKFSYRFHCVILSVSAVPEFFFLIIYMTHLSFNIASHDLHDFVHLLEICLLLILFYGFIFRWHTWCYQNIFKVAKVCVCVCFPGCCMFQRKFYGLVNGMYILCYYMEYSVDICYIPFYVRCHLKFVFLCSYFIHTTSFSQKMTYEMTYHVKKCLVIPITFVPILYQCIL